MRAHELRTAALLTGLGCEVRCIDPDSSRVSSLAAGSLPSLDHWTQAALVDALRSSRLDFSTDLAENLDSSDLVFLAPPIGVRRHNLHLAFSYARQVGEAFKSIGRGIPVVVQSPVPAGFTRAVGQVISSHFDFGDCLAFNPFPYETPTGRVVLVGTDCPGARESLVNLYSRSFDQSHMVVSGLETGELVYSHTHPTMQLRTHRDSYRSSRIA